MADLPHATTCDGNWYAGRYTRCPACLEHFWLYVDDMYDQHTLSVNKITTTSDAFIQAIAQATESIIKFNDALRHVFRKEPAGWRRVLPPYLQRKRPW